MKTLSLTDLKNKLGMYMELVRAGQALLILDRNRPIATLSPVKAGLSPSHALSELQRKGLVKLAKGALSSRELESLTVNPTRHVSVVDILVKERESTR